MVPLHPPSFPVDLILIIHTESTVCTLRRCNFTTAAPLLNATISFFLHNGWWRRILDQLRRLINICKSLQFSVLLQTHRFPAGDKCAIKSFDSSASFLNPEGCSLCCMFLLCVRLRLKMNTHTTSENTSQPPKALKTHRFVSKCTLFTSVDMPNAPSVHTFYYSLNA